MPERLIALFEKTFGEPLEATTALRPHASNRQFYRLRSARRSVIGVLHDNRRENEAFVHFTKHFKSFGLPVPELYATDLTIGAYLEEDLGDTTLLDFLGREQVQPGFVSPVTEALYGRAVELLPRFQIEAGRSVPFQYSHPFRSYNRTAMRWDMHYFRDAFLRRTGIHWNNVLLERDFQTLADFLLQADSNFFMYRDFQARNIMVRNGDLAFIDYQDGRCGPLQWDVVSLLFQSKAALPADVRDRLLNRYLESAAQYVSIDRGAFLRYLHAFVFIRLMQVLGTYGEKGLGEKKEYFMASIPHAIRNLKSLLEINPLPVHLPALTSVCADLVAHFEQGGGAIYAQPLTVKVYSFSYREGMPRDAYEHGGGFVFDCRCLQNPGREPQYRELTGLDRETADYFQARPEVEQFLHHVFGLVQQAVGNYLSRGFVRLAVFFGCTGGQHRSVYAAEHLARQIREVCKLEVEVEHLQLSREFPEKLGAAVAQRSRS
jgi:aminoglycoside/choline kinase family phosphotransferase